MVGISTTLGSLGLQWLGHETSLGTGSGDKHPQIGGEV